MSGDPRAEYRQRMLRVLQHIEEHLDEPLDLPTLAAVAHFSPFHFHRLFAAWMGETLGDYLRRRRLQTAATFLDLQPRLTVLQAALSVGFGSGEAFTRAFRAFYGCSPTAWRRQRAERLRAKRNAGQVGRNPGQDDPAQAGQHEGPQHAEPEILMNVQVLDLPPTRIGYLRRVGPYGPGVAAFWQAEVYPWMVAHRLLEQPRYGISHDDPSIVPDEQCRYDACVALPEGFDAPRQMLTTTLPGGRYAVLRFEGTVFQIGERWQALLRDWLPASGLQVDARPCYEYYPPGTTYDPQTGIFDCDICIPVEPL